MTSSSKRVGAVARKVFRSLAHDRRTLGLVVIAPVFSMLMFGFIFGTELQHVPVQVVNQDRGDLAAKIIGNLDPVKVTVTQASSLDAARNEVIEGRAKAVLYFPANFTEDSKPVVTPAPPCNQPVPQLCPPAVPTVTPAKGVDLVLVLDGTNSASVAVVTQALGDALQATAKQLGAASPIRIQNQYAYAEGAKVTDFLVPGVLAFAVINFTASLTLLAFVAERTGGTMARLLTSPVKEWEIVAGYTLAYGTLSLLQALVLLGTGVVLFHVLVVGSIALAFLVLVLLAIDALSLGILLSASAQNPIQAMQTLPLIIFPTFLLSGIFVPLEALPDLLRPLAYLIPPTYAVEALRAIMLRGWGLDRIGLDVLALAGFAVVFLAVAVNRLKQLRA